MRVTEYNVRLSLRMKEDGRDWLVWCPILDVATQARTKRKALEGLREAVELWFESCISRGVLDQALQEAGFATRSGDQIPPDANNCVTVRTVQNPDSEQHMPTNDT